jgi:hypothetical protein
MRPCSTPLSFVASLPACLTDWLTALPSLPLALPACPRRYLCLTSPRWTGRTSKDLAHSLTHSPFLAHLLHTHTQVSVLDKSKMDWQDFKKTDKEVQEELEAHARSDKQYLDKQVCAIVCAVCCGTLWWWRCKHTGGGRRRELTGAGRR